MSAAAALSKEMRKTLILAALLASAAPIAPALAQSAASPFTSATRYDVMRRVTGTIAPDPDGGRGRWASRPSATPTTRRGGW